MAKTPVRVAITGAAGQIGYSLLYRVARGDLLGPDQPLILQLLEITPALGSLNGAVNINLRLSSLENTGNVRITARSAAGSRGAFFARASGANRQSAASTRPRWNEVMNLKLEGAEFYKRPIEKCEWTYCEWGIDKKIVCERGQRDPQRQRDPPHHPTRPSAATFAFIRRTDLDDSLAIAELLANDSDDSVQKAVGWMLREIGKQDPKRHAQFLDRHAATMPRVMLRYAIEKLSPDERKSYMARAGTAEPRLAG